MNQHRWLLAMLLLPLLQIHATVNFMEAYEKVKQYSFKVPRPYRLRAARNLGSLERMRLFTEKLATGQAVRISAVGGSVTAGQNTGRGAASSWAQQFFGMLNATFPHPDHSLLNGGVAGTDSLYMVTCWRQHVDMSADLIFLDYALNDSPVPDLYFTTRARRAFERLIRKLLRLPSSPAVVLVDMFSVRHSNHGHPYLSNAERDHYELASYYDLPLVSTKAALFHLIYRNVTNFSQMEVYGGLVGGNHTPTVTTHPNIYGSELIAECALTFVQQALLFLSAQEAFTATSWAPDQLPGIPSPLAANNYETMNNLCIIGHQMLPQVIENSGWNFTDEGRGPQKLGFVGMHSGAVLRVKLEVQAFSFDNEGAVVADDQVAPTMGVNQTVAVHVVYLQSYMGMGKLQVSCESGCACDSAIVDTTTNRKVSLSTTADLHVTPSTECVLRIEVLEASSSGGHKVKILGFAMSEETSATGGKGVLTMIRMATFERGGAGAFPDQVVR